jgi:hypothetical protein
MQTAIFIGGKERPVQVDMGLAYDYEITTGRALHEDINAITSGLSLVKIVDLMYTALAVPIREKGGIVDFRPRDVAAWIAETPTAAEKFARILNDAFGIPVSDEPLPDEGEKKKRAAIGKS